MMMRMNMISRNKKMILAISLCLVVLGMIFLSGTHVFAAGNVADVIEKSWKETASQFKDIANKVVFPAIDFILLVCFVAKLATCYFDYKKTGHFEFAGPAILLGGLIFALTAPLYIWQIIGV